MPSPLTNGDIHTYVSMMNPFSFVQDHLFLINISPSTQPFSSM